MRLPGWRGYREERIDDLLEVLENASLRGGLTRTTIVALTGIPGRTVLRYFEEIERRGFTLKRWKLGKRWYYTIVKGETDDLEP